MATGIRESSKEQFSEGTSIDGNRLEKFLQNVQDRWNKLKHKDIKNRFVVNTFVGGYSPDQNPIYARHLPWMNAENRTGESFAPVPSSFMNQWRQKGLYTPGVLEGSATDYLLSWTTNIEFIKPVILDQVFVSFFVDGAYYTNYFQYIGPTPPPGKSIGQSVDDIKVIVSVDNPFLTETRELNMQEVMHYSFDAKSVYLNRGSLAITNTMSPLGAINSGYSLAISLDDLNIPIPEKGRVRFSIIIPQYGSYDSSWGTQSEIQQSYSWSMTVLEELQK